MNRNAQIDQCCKEGWCSVGQNLAHMPRIYHICSKLKPRIIVESGVGGEGHGSSTYTFLTIAKEMNAELYSLDSAQQNLWFRKRFPDLDYSRWHFVLGNSVEILKALQVEIDFLHLDSGHSFEHVTSELETSQKILSPIHVIASHDTEVSQEGCRRAMHDWATKNNYTLKQFEDDHGETFLTNASGLFDGLD